MTRINREIQAGVKADLERIREIFGHDPIVKFPHLDRYGKAVLREKREKERRRKRSTKRKG